MTNKKVLSVLVALTSLGVFSACEKKEEAAVDTSATTTSSGLTPIGTVDNSRGFYVATVPDSSYEYRMHEGTSVTSTGACEVTEASSNKDITCIIEAPELDIHFFGAKLNYNVPTTMCTYLQFNSYWFWSHRVGQGPTSMQKLATSATTYGAPVISGGSGNLPPHGYFDGSTPVCNYDYSANDGPNCCTGKYVLDVREWDTTVNAPTGVLGAANPSMNDWGGDASSCIAGPAVDNMPLDKAGFPMAKIYFIENKGMNDKYEIDPPIKNGWGSNVYASNYFVAGSVPEPLQLTAGRQPKHFFEFQCLDRAKEIKARIRVQIREWNDLNSFLTSNANAGTLGGTEPGYLDETGSLFPINDYADWRDFFAVPGSFPGKP